MTHTVTQAALNQHLTPERLLFIRTRASDDAQIFGAHRAAHRLELLAELDLSMKERDDITLDFTKIVEHAMDLERTLYRLVQSLLLDQMFTLDHESRIATPADEIATYVGDYWTRSLLYAALTHAVDLTQHICPSCEGFGGE